MAQEAVAAVLVVDHDFEALQQTADIADDGIGTLILEQALIDRIREEFSGQEVSVVATGGNAPVIVKYCRNKIVYDKYLLMEGLLAIYKKNQ